MNYNSLRRSVQRNNTIHRNRNTTHTNQNNNNSNDNLNNNNANNRESILVDTNNVLQNNDDENSITNESMPELQGRHEDSNDEDSVDTNVYTRTENGERTGRTNDHEDNQQVVALRIRGGGQGTSGSTSSSLDSSDIFSRDSDSLWNSESDSDESIQIATRVGNVVIEDEDDTLHRQSLREELQTAKRMEFDITSITMEDSNDFIDTDTSDEMSESDSEDSIESSTQASAPQVVRGKHITDFFSPTTKAFVPKRFAPGGSPSSSSDEVSQALENLSSSMERLNHLQQIHNMLGNIHDANSPPFSNHVRQAGSPFKSSKNRARKNKPSSVSEPPIRETPSATPSVINSPITVEDVDSVASMEVITEVSNFYEGSSCDTTSISDLSNDDGIDDSVSLYNDIPDLIEAIPVEEEIDEENPDSLEACAIG